MVSIFSVYDDSLLSESLVTVLKCFGCLLLFLVLYVYIVSGDFFVSSVFF